MKKILSFLFLIFLHAYTDAQQINAGADLSIAMGNPFRMPDGYRYLGFISDSDSESIQLSYNPKDGLLIQAFNSNLNLSNEVRLRIENFPKDFDNEKVIQLGDNYFWFFSTRDKGKNEKILWAQQIDLRNKTLVGKNIAILKSPATIGKYITRISFRKNYLLFSYHLKHKSNDDSINKEEIGFCVIDSALNVVTDCVVEMPFTEEIMDNKDYLIDSYGNAYLLAKIFEQGRQPSLNSRPNYHYLVLHLMPGEHAANELPVYLQPLFYHFLSMSENGNKDIFISGLYSYHEEVTTNNGIFITKLNKKGNFSAFGSGYYDFPKSLLNQFLPEYDSRHWQKKTILGGQAQLLVLRNTIMLADGGIELLGEVYYSTTTSFSELFFGEILAVRINAKGQLEWMNVIPRHQTGSNGLKSLSFNYYIEMNNTYLLFSDKMENLNIKPGCKPEMYVDGKDGCLAYTKIDFAGNVSKAKLYDFSKDEFICRPADLKLVGNGSLSCIASQGRMNRLIVIKKPGE
jgi:hypothetical protein